jgi:hypothetical protein
MPSKCGAGTSSTAKRGQLNQDTSNVYAGRFSVQTAIRATLCCTQLAVHGFKSALKPNPWFLQSCIHMLVQSRGKQPATCTNISFTQSLEAKLHICADNTTSNNRSISCFSYNQRARVADKHTANPRLLSHHRLLLVASSSCSSSNAADVSNPPWVASCRKLSIVQQELPCHIELTASHSRPPTPETASSQVKTTTK